MGFLFFIQTTRFPQKAQFLTFGQKNIKLHLEDSIYGCPSLVKCKVLLLYLINCVKLTFIQFSSVAQSCPTLCNPMNHSTPGLPVHHQLPEFTQTHAHRVGDAIQPSHPLLSPSPPAPNPSQHQGLFQ